jgi:4-diphosphocytidyl-2-C-methyl-D-erythritol kinase
MNNNRLTIEARAKINLALDVLHKRDDGYHEVQMVMQTIALADRISLSEADQDISVSTNIAGLDCGPSNLAFRAAALLRDKYNVDRGVNIILDKKIPMAAGLAGGSADAAAVLKGLNELWNLGINIDELKILGATLGSDVPFCLTGGTMLATGRGECLDKLPSLPHCWVVLAKPPISLSTAWVYGRYKPGNVSFHPDIKGMLDCLAKQNLQGVAARLGNVLESVSAAAYPVIAELKKWMQEYGAMASLMSGSGPTVFALAAQEGTARRIASAMENWADSQIIVTETVNSLGGEDGTKVIADKA